MIAPGKSALRAPCAARRRFCAIGCRRAYGSLPSKTRIRWPVYRRILPFIASKDLFYFSCTSAIESGIH